MRSLILLFLITSCTTKPTNQLEEITIIDTIFIEIPHQNLGSFYFPSRVDTIIDEYKIHLEKFN